MATLTTDFQAPARSSFAFIRNFFSAIGGALMAAAENSSRTHEIDTLQALSDAELAERGLKRDEIVHYVFRDMLYI